MKGHNGTANTTLVAAAPYKRRWRGTVAVCVLVVLSLLVPFVFLFGLHTRPGDLIDERKHSEAIFHNYSSVINHVKKPNPPKSDENIVHESVKEEAQSLENASKNHLDQADGASAIEVNTNLESIDAQLTPPPKDVSSVHEPKNVLVKARGPSTVEAVPTKATSSPSSKVNNQASAGAQLTAPQSPEPETVPLKAIVPPTVNVAPPKALVNVAPPKALSSPSSKVDYANISSADEALASCQLEFGSYCLWSKAHKQAMNDSLVRRLKDQLFMARAYYPSIAKLQGKEQLAGNLKLNIQDHERIFSEAISDPDLPAYVMRYFDRMDKVVVKAQSCSVDCSNIDKKLRQLVDLTEDEAHFHMKQSAFLYQLGIQTLAKSLHCLSMRLTVEFFRSPFKDTEQLHAHKLWNPSLQHYVIFTRNVLAVSVTINSAVMNSEETENMIFHVITDKQNFYSMKYWFIRNSYKNSIVQVLNFDDLEISDYDARLLQMVSSEEFRVSFGNKDSLLMQTEYISVFSHSHFLLPEIFKDLKKIIVLDDDVVIQKDLQFFWNLDMEGKVNGAVEFCKIRLAQLKTRLGNNKYGHDSCAWMSGVNIIDLQKWRERNITGTYRRFIAQLQITDDASWRSAALQASLLAFDGEVHALDDAWIESGLGYNYGTNADVINNAVVLHYNGNMKPWLDLGILDHKKYWKKYLTREPFMEECNVNL